MTTTDDFLRVSHGSNPQSVAAAIAHAIYDTQKVRLRAIGAGSVNQAVKAIGIASGFVAPRGYVLACMPSFATIEGNDGPISAIVIDVFTIQR